MKKTSYALAATAAMIALAIGSKGFAASTTGTAKQIVIQAIAITNVSDLDFGSAPPADAAKTVDAIRPMVLPTAASTSRVSRTRATRSHFRLTAQSP